MLFEKLSSNITDLPGVEGICLLEQNGAILYKRMPAFIPDSAYEEVVRRVSSLYETIDENLLPADDYILKFADKIIVLRRIGNVILMLLNATGTNLISLRMVTNLTLKHLQSTPTIVDELRNSAQSLPVPAAAAAASAPVLPSSPATPPSSLTPTAPDPASTTKEPKPTKWLRVYRGQVVE